MPPENEWRVVRNTHEPIIDEDTFAKAQEMAEQSRANYRKMIGKHEDLKSPNLFKKLIFCGDCGKCMVRQHVHSNWPGCKEYYYHFKCTTYLKMSSACTPKNLKETHLLEVVRDTIQQHLSVVGSLLERVLGEYAAVSGEKKQEISQQIQRETQGHSHTKALLDGLYQNLVDGLIDRDEFVSMKAHYQEQLALFQQRLDELQEQIRGIERYGPSNPMFVAYKAYSNMELSEELIHALVA